MSLLLNCYEGGTLPTVKYIDLAEFTNLALPGKTVIVGGITYTLSTTGETANSAISQGTPSASKFAEALASAVNAEQCGYGTLHNVVTLNLTCCAEAHGTRVYFATRIGAADLAITGSFTPTTVS